MPQESLFLEFEGNDINTYSFLMFSEDHNDCALIETNMGRVLLVHGREYGSLTIDDDELFNIYQAIDHIVCCHPKQVCLFYEIIFPDIWSKVFFPDHNGYVYSNTVVVEDTVLMEIRNYKIGEKL